MLLPAVTKPSPMSCARRASGVAPANPPVPFTFKRPVQAAAVAGSQTSNLISESDEGRAVPVTRQNGTLIVVPPMTAGGVTTVADVMVAASDVTDDNCSQVYAACPVPYAAVSPSASAKPMLPLFFTDFPCGWFLAPASGASLQHSSTSRAINLRWSSTDVYLS
jgi:hypothetical protein